MSLSGFSQAWSDKSFKGIERLIWIALGDGDGLATMQSLKVATNDDEVAILDAIKRMYPRVTEIRPSDRSTFIAVEFGDAWRYVK